MTNPRQPSKLRRPLFLSALGLLLPGRLIAYSRLALAMFALVATYLDPTQPSRYSNLAYFILIGYVVYSGVVAALAARLSKDLSGGLVRHTFDLLVFAGLSYLTRGPTSPFFIFFTFAILSGALRWGRKGAFLTAGVLLAWYIGISVYEFSATGPDPDLNRVIVRAGYLAVAAAFIGYFGDYRDRSRQLLEQLANWPSVLEAADDRPALESILAHTALVLDIDRIVVLWAAEDMSNWRYAHWNKGTCAFGLFEPGKGTPPLARQGAPILSSDADPERRSLIQNFAGRFDLAVSVWAPLRTADLFGFLLIPGPAPGGAEFESLTRIVAGRIESEFEHFRLTSKLTEAATSAERVRVARALHDSVLQNLTATALQLKAKAASAPLPARADIEEVVRLLGDEQRRIREIASGANSKSDDGSRLADLEAAVQSLADKYYCTIALRVLPQSSDVTENELRKLIQILTEAVTGLVLPHPARAIEVSVEVSDAVRVVLQHEGPWDDPKDREAMPAHPLSLVRGVEVLGARCTFPDTQGAIMAVEFNREL